MVGPVCGLRGAEKIVMTKEIYKQLENNFLQNFCDDR